ncbi:hypothetical protein [Sedimenticola selenatireducens]|uniref:hypothetical protein n=1 Tax=Sedimenticola selenatireducens TaxID=191960 RepID=UPI00048F7F70|nr:hypothetical protein [Sedimenticola selenatireducens]
MKILIPHVPTAITRQDLLSVVQGAVKPKWFMPFRSGGTVAKCKLVRILDMDTGGVEFHGLVDIYPDKTAEKTIKRLNGTTINGYRLSVRKWVDRTLMAGGTKTLPEGQPSCKRRRHLEISIT